MRIKDALEALNSLLEAGIVESFAIGGAVGATFYIDPIATVDLDVFVIIPASPGMLILNPLPIFDYLSSKGFAMKGEHVVIGGWPVQFLAPSGPLVEEALAMAVRREVEGTTTFVFSAEHLAAISLETGRAKDKNRLLQFIESGVLDAVRFSEIVERHGLNTAWGRFQSQFLGEEL